MVGFKIFQSQTPLCPQSAGVWEGRPGGETHTTLIYTHTQLFGLVTGRGGNKADCFPGGQRLDEKGSWGGEEGWGVGGGKGTY